MNLDVEVVVGEGDATRRRRVRWWHLAVFVVLLGVGAFVAWHISLDRRLERELDAIRAAGYPATPKELDAWYVHVPDEENAALVWLDAGSLVGPLADAGDQAIVDEVRWGGVNVEPWEPYPEATLDLMVEYGAQNASALNRAREAGALTRSRYPIDLSAPWADMDWTQYSLIHEAVSLLTVLASVEADIGASDRAAKTVTLILSAADTLRGAPIHTAQSERMALQATAVSMIERVLNRCEPNERDLEKLSRSIERTLRAKPLAMVVIGERAGRTFESLIDARGGSGGTSVEDMMYRAMGYLELSDLTLLEYSERALRIATLPYHERMAALDSILMEVDYLSWKGRMTGILLDSLDNLIRIEMYSRADLLHARAALAVELYRLANDGALPASLEALVPGYLEAVPVDPFDGKALRYFKTTEGYYTVYSVGEDGVDNGGTLTDASGERDMPGTDRVFRVRR